LLALACSNASESEKTARTAADLPGISQEVAQFENALARAKKEPAKSLLLCNSLEDPQLESDCILAVAPQLAKADRQAASAACKEIKALDECFFRLAEATKDSDLCEQAGEHEIDCRLHVFSFSISDWLEKDASPETLLDKGPGHIHKAGLKTTDSRAWTALWRWRIGVKTPLDRSICALLDPIQKSHCNRAGEGLFHDRLNHFRDKGAALCQGELPPALQITEDSGLEAILKMRRTQDLCDPNARHAPPPTPIPGHSR